MAGPLDDPQLAALLADPAALAEGLAFVRAFDQAFVAGLVEELRGDFPGADEALLRRYAVAINRGDTEEINAAADLLAEFSPEQPVGEAEQPVTEEDQRQLLAHLRNRPAADRAEAVAYAALATHRARQRVRLVIASIVSAMFCRARSSRAPRRSRRASRFQQARAPDGDGEPPRLPVAPRALVAAAESRGRVGGVLRFRSPSSPITTTARLVAALEG